MPIQRSHSTQAVLVAVIWGLNFVAIDYGLDSFPPLLFGALRFTLVAIPAVFFVPRPKIALPLLVGIGMFVCVLQFALLFSAMHLGMPAGLSSIVLQCQPMFTVLFALLFLGERPARARLAALALAAAGLGVIAVGRGQSAGVGPFLLVVAAGAAWAMGNVLTRKAGSQAGFGLVVWSGLVAPLPLFGLSLAFEGWSADREAMTGLGMSGVLALLYVVVVSTFIGYGLWNNLLSRFPANVVAPYSLLVPVVGIAAAALVLGERPTAWDWAGGGVVMLGLALMSGVLAPRRGNARGRAPEGSPATGPEHESAAVGAAAATPTTV
ncbi:EamA family transporter [Yinghuangia soli]|uniref:EamA family transporter n=1 Tax=Yinghuangia soli TaxID=2908204 RepID=A0AA41U107_9ACTN|nr:EamA family transporter [Yinghuangia soli]MCF2525659.1 EamA family transporter [Yinghuangia soli]